MSLQGISITENFSSSSPSLRIGVQDLGSKGTESISITETFSPGMVSNGNFSLSKGELQETVNFAVMDAIAKMGVLEKQDAVIRTLSQMPTPDFSNITRMLTPLLDLLSLKDGQAELKEIVKMNSQPDFSRVFMTLEQHSRDHLAEISKIKVNVAAPDLSSISTAISGLSNRQSETLDAISKVKPNVPPPDLSEVNRSLAKLKEDMKQMNRELKDDIKKAITESKFDPKDLNIKVDPPNLTGIEQQLARSQDKMQLTLKETKEDLKRLYLDNKISASDLSVSVDSPDFSRVEQLVTQIGRQQDRLRDDLKENTRGIHKELKDDLRKAIAEGKIDLRDLNVTVEPPNLQKIEQLIGQVSRQEERVAADLKSDIRRMQKESQDEVRKLILDNKIDIKDLNVVIEPPNLVKVEQMISQRKKEQEDLANKQKEDIKTMNKELREDLKKLVTVNVEPPDLSSIQTVQTDILEAVKKIQIKDPDISPVIAEIRSIDAVRAFKTSLDFGALSDAIKGIGSFPVTDILNAINVVRTNIQEASRPSMDVLLKLQLELRQLREGLAVTVVRQQVPQMVSQQAVVGAPAMMRSVSPCPPEPIVGPMLVRAESRSPSPGTRLITGSATGVPWGSGTLPVTVAQAPAAYAWNSVSGPISRGPASVSFSPGEMRSNAMSPSSVMLVGGETSSWAPAPSLLGGDANVRVVQETLAPATMPSSLVAPALPVVQTTSSQPWWVQLKVTPEGPLRRDGGNEYKTFSDAQQDQFGITFDGNVIDKSKFDEAIKGYL